MLTKNLFCSFIISVVMLWHVVASVDWTAICWRSADDAVAVGSPTAAAAVGQCSCWYCAGTVCQWLPGRRCHDVGRQADGVNTGSTFGHWFPVRCDCFVRSVVLCDNQKIVTQLPPFSHSFTTNIVDLSQSSCHWPVWEEWQWQLTLLMRLHNHKILTITLALTLLINCQYML